MWIAFLLLGLAATYLPPVIAARGRGSRGMWIGLIFVGLFVGVVLLMIGHLVAPNNPVLFSKAKDVSFARQMTVNLLSRVVRVSISFGFGSFLAALLYRKRQATSQSLLGLGSEINKRQI